MSLNDRASSEGCGASQETERKTPKQHDIKEKLNYEKRV
jgi:hypothetical protein